MTTTTREFTGTHTADPGTVLLRDNTLEQIVDNANQMFDASHRLEKQIWAVRAEAYRQLDLATKAYSEAFAQNGILDPQIEELEKAIARVRELEKLWNSAVAVRNRAAHFSDIDGRPVFEVLSKVFTDRGPDPFEESLKQRRAKECPEGK